MKNLNLLLALLFISFTTSAQIWEENLLKTNANPTSAEKFEAFENYRKTVPYTKGNGYKPYAREMDFVNERIKEGNVIQSKCIIYRVAKRKRKIQQRKIKHCR